MEWIFLDTYCVWRLQILHSDWRGHSTPTFKIFQKFIGSIAGIGTFPSNSVEIGTILNLHRSASNPEWPQKRDFLAQNDRKGITQLFYDPDF